MNVGIQGIATDPQAFEAFYLEHIERVQRFVARRVDDPYLAADLTADVFVAVLEAAQNYRASKGTPIGWLYGVAHHIVAAELRRSARDLRAQGRVAGRRLLSGDDLIRLEERLDAEADARGLYIAMEGLPASQRAVLELTALEGLSVTEAATALGIRPVTARVRLHRAREAMRVHIPNPHKTSMDQPKPEVIK